MPASGSAGGASAVELERLIVRLMMDAKQFEDTLKQAQTQANQAGKAIETGIQPAEHAMRGISMSARDARHAIHLFSSVTGAEGIARPAMMGVHAFHLLEHAMHGLGAAAAPAIGAIGLAMAAIIPTAVHIKEVLESWSAAAEDAKKGLEEAHKFAFKGAEAGEKPLAVVEAEATVEARKEVGEALQKAQEFITGRSQNRFVLGLRQLGSLVGLINSAGEDMEYYNKLEDMAGQEVANRVKARVEEYKKELEFRHEQYKLTAKITDLEKEEATLAKARALGEGRKPFQVEEEKRLDEYMKKAGASREEAEAHFKPLFEAEEILRQAQFQKVLTDEVTQFGVQTEQAAIRMRDGADAAELYGIAQKHVKDTLEDVNDVMEQLRPAFQKMKDTMAFEKIFEKTRTPMEQFVKRMEQLDRMLKTGVITNMDDYQRAVAALRKELFGAAVANEKFDAAASGSAEAVTRQQEQIDRLNASLIGGMETVGGPGKAFEATGAAGAEAASRGQQQVDILKDIRDGIDEMNRKKQGFRPANIGGAGFGGASGGGIT